MAFGRRHIQLAHIQFNVDMFGVGKFRQHHHRLHRACPAEHIDALNLFGGVSAFGQDFGVAGEGWRAAGDVDDAFGRGGDDGAQDGGVTALARWVEDDDVRAETVGNKLREKLFRRADVKDGVFNVIARGVLIGVPDGFGNDFNADDFFGFLRQKQGDGSRAAVGVHDGFVSGQTGVFERKPVELFSLRGIDLKEGERRNGEAKPAERVLHRAFAPEDADVRTEDDVRLAGIDAQAQAAKTGDGCFEQLDELIGFRNVHAGNDEDDHQLAMGRRAGHNMADEPATGQLVISANAVLSHPCEDGLRRFGGILPLNGASVCGQRDEVVTARSKETAGGRTADLRDRISALIAVAERMLHAENGRHGDGKPADTLKQILYLAALEGKGGFIGHMLADTAAAALIDGAEGLRAVRTFFQQFLDAPESIAFFGLDDAHARAFTGEQTGNEHGDAILTANALRVLTEGFAGHFKALVFGEHGHSPYFLIRIGLLRMRCPLRPQGTAPRFGGRWHGVAVTERA